ncbi:MAG TPA: hypothetical protein PKD85_13245 [Saprospiraceae bacterium]|nr:hypothetical protein [Saprospiraceae bacterium]
MTINDSQTLGWNLFKKMSFRFAFIYFMLFICLLDWYGLNLTSIIFVELYIDILLTIVGMNTDGSSGASKAFKLPNSKFEVRFTTMVSFQKNGIILDGFGTAPDIILRRDLNQILWKSDSQLESLKKTIKKSH